MSPVREHNRRLVLARRPCGMVDPGTVRLEWEPVPEPGEGQALVAVRHVSIDPTIRSWMNDGPSSMPPIGLGEVIRSYGAGQVIASNDERYPQGSVVTGLTGWQDYVVTDGAAAPLRVLGAGVTPRHALGVFGVTGMAAYFGMLDVGRVREGDTVVVSGAAGAVGSVAGQIARIKGARRVVGVCGGPAKCSWIVDELGFDAAVDYRSGDIGAQLAAVCPDGADLVFDTAGGEILDACLGQLALGGRVVVCGATSRYNDVAPAPGPVNYFNLVLRSGRMEGFLVRDYVDRFAEARAQMAPWIADGRLEHVERVIDGLEHAPEALHMLFTGATSGKLVVRV